MAERIVSPGVFTRERDLSFLEQGISEIGGAFVGATQKGPAFIPKIITSQTAFENTYGKADEYSYLGYTVQNYLQEANSATVVRVLGLNGYLGTTYTSAKLTVSGSGGQQVLAIIHPTKNDVSIASASASGTPTSMTLVLSGSTGEDSFTGVSAEGISANNVARTLGESPFGSYAGYSYSFFPDAINTDLGGIEIVDDVIMVTSSVAVDFTGSSYTNASTPWIRSQTISGAKRNLFVIHTLDDGSNANKSIKASIQSIKYPILSGSYGTFSLVVRSADDTDQRMNVLEQHDNLTLDPNSPDFIARRIGNAIPTQDSVTNETYYQGDYSIKSQYIRIVLDTAVDNGSMPNIALPYGFAGMKTPFVLEGEESAVKPHVVNTQWTSTGSYTGYGGNASQDTRIFYGYDFTSTNYTNWSYLNPTPSGATQVGYEPLTTGSAALASEFSLEDVEDNEVGGTDDLDLTVATHIAYRKFTVAFQGGFDGFEPNRLRAIGSDITATNSQGYDISTSTAEGSVAFKRALDAISNPETFDINLLVVPGVNYEQHPYIVQYAIDMCEARSDCFYILDLASYAASIATAVATAQTLDSSYAAGYYPWVKVLNTNTNKFVWAPPSVVLPEVFAYSDNVAAEWFAPAGLNRGGIPGATDVKSRLSVALRDELYENKVNPIAKFPGQGVVAYGQKTLQTNASALDRINVRRLLIAVTKFIASYSRFLVFEQNTETTRNRFLNIANPYLASIQERQGLYAFRVVMDETNNTADVIDRNIMQGAIYLQPTKTAEFIKIDFNILPTGAAFGS